MCGIAGFWSPAGIDLAEARYTLTGMTAIIRHRGPDDTGEWVDPDAAIALGFRRLSIIDLSPGGHQPMVSGSGRFVIVFNGEIYNFPELRKELLELGCSFRSRSDTEVLLAAIESWGVRPALARFNGMFAFALWDRRDRALYLARDRAGEKPLYYGWHNGVLLFGSELKALRAHPAFCGRINREALTLYLRHGYVPGPYSIYQGIRKLPPGCILTVDAAHFDQDAMPAPYWSAQTVIERGIAEPFAGDEADAVEELDHLLRDAVRMRMEADVPLGAFLSAGVDSSCVVALMQAQSSRPVKTFTIGFHAAAHDEARDAAKIARHLGTEHTELYLTPAEALEVIPRLPVLYDEPFADTSQIPTFLVSRLARRQVTVSLSGDGGDELFGGYRRHQLGPSLWRGIHWLPLSVRRGAARLVSPRNGTSSHFGSYANRLVRTLTGKRSLTERFRQAAEILTVQSPQALYHYMMSVWKHPSDLVPGESEAPVAATDPARWPFLDAPEHVMMYLDLVGYLPDDILVKLDRASMGVSLEARVPLLDHRVIEFAWRLPLRTKVQKGSGKRVLRRVLERYVPAHLINRSKRGFHMPIAAWLRGPLRDWGESLLSEARLRHDGVFQSQQIRAKWHQHLSGVTRWDGELWTVLMFQSWLDATASEHHVSR